MGGVRVGGGLHGGAGWDEFDPLRQKWADMLTGGPEIKAADAVMAATMSLTNTANTHWAALNKGGTRTALWADAASTTDLSDLSTNFSRLRAMGLGYATVGAPLRGNAALRDDLRAGLDWM